MPGGSARCSTFQVLSFSPRVPKPSAWRSTASSSSPRMCVSPAAVHASRVPPQAQPVGFQNLVMGADLRLYPAFVLADESSENRSTPVGFQNSAGASDLRFQAAGSYSLIRARREPADAGRAVDWLGDRQFRARRTQLQRSMRPLRV
jgi:hypothetical protein